jgi:hypothetical protein
VVGTNGRLEEEEEDDDGRPSPTATKMTIKSSEKMGILLLVDC